MNGTPRLRSAFPNTPQSNNRSRQSTPLRHGIKRVRLPAAPAAGQQPAPVVPVDLLDTGTQRFLVVAFYVGLWAYKISDFWGLYASDDTESLWLFMKWVVLDGMFLFGLPALRIPWLEWSPGAMTGLFLIHATLDGMMMFQIGIPVLYWLELLFKTFYNREIAISERRVKPAAVLDHTSLFLGKQVINILPEGSAFLNPDNDIFCLGGSVTQVQLPIQVNQTVPSLIELRREDLESEDIETISIKSSEAKKMRNLALKQQKPADPHDPILLRYAVKKTGRYTIAKIEGDSGKVRPRASEVVVVNCPSARIKLVNPNRCRGDLSDLAFDVRGTPPLKIKYRKSVNGNPMEASFQSIQPESFVSPMMAKRQEALVTTDKADISWARSQTVTVPVNETMSIIGKYRYTIEEVQDAIGNREIYSTEADDDEQQDPKDSPVRQTIAVDDRPLIWIPRQAACNAERPLKVAKGKTAELPHRITSVGRTESEVEMSRKDDYAFLEDHFIEYDFIPEASLAHLNTTEYRALIKTIKRSSSSPIAIKEPGLYTLKSVWTGHCQGEVSEPSSCLLQNPPQPSVTIESDPITDKCAGNPVGLRLTLDFEGSPPFTVQYTRERAGDKNTRYLTRKFSGHREQLELVPDEAGAYKYKFIEIKDQFYDSISLSQEFKQEVKPSASAQLDPPPAGGLHLCKGSPAIFGVRLSGEPPFTLEYEVIHGKSKKKGIAEDIHGRNHELQVKDLNDGGEYTLSITSVTDKTGCKEFLSSEQPFHVWSQRPTASFAAIDRKYSARILEGKSLRLPLRFTGQAPFLYKIIHQESGEVQTQRISHASAVFEAKKSGVYEITEVEDVHCPGVVDVKANSFKVDWIGRPSLSFAQSPAVSLIDSKHDRKWSKTEVCEGDDDYVELAFQGAPPFDVKYEESAHPNEGQKYIRKKELNAALGIASIQLDTDKAGKYEYKFLELADNNYDPDPKRQSGLILHQSVHSRPTARFTNPGKIYSYCASEESSGEDSVPITFTGQPPYTLEVDIKHSGSASPASIDIPNIKANPYNFKVDKKYLIQGHSHLTIRRVKDSNGCYSKVDPAIPLSRVQISVHDPPSIAPIEANDDFCVGDRLSFRLSGVPPFSVVYEFENVKKKATSSETTFRRLAERAGEFEIKAISDSSSNCQFTTSLKKTIHPLPSAKISKGREKYTDIQEGGQAELLFEFTGTPPFEFTYTRSENAGKRKKGVVLETKTERTDQPFMTVKASEEGTYEVISVRDKWCAVSRAATEDDKKSQKLLMQ